MLSNPAGYSGTPLPKKLGFKEGFRALFVNPPAGFAESLDLPGGVEFACETDTRPLDLSVLFVKSEAELRAGFEPIARRLAPAGMLWVSWPKRSSGVPTDLNENTIRDFGLAVGLVDVKVCAIDETWSGLKFVIRLKDRPGR